MCGVGALWYTSVLRATCLVWEETHLCSADRTSTSQEQEYCFCSFHLWRRLRIAFVTHILRHRILFPFKPGMWLKGHIDHPPLQLAKH